MTYITEVGIASNTRRHLRGSGCVARRQFDLLHAADAAVPSDERSVPDWGMDHVWCIFVSFMQLQV